MPTGIRETVTSVLAIAGVSTLGDFIWATWIPRHRPIYGLTHGSLLFVAIGLALGYWAGNRVRGAVAGGITGFLTAGSFYVLAPVFGFAVMFAVWFGMWVALAWLNGWLNGRGGLKPVVSRGLIAAVLSGGAFYGISGIWMPFDPAGWDYAIHFGAWTLAYLPGFGALYLSRMPAVRHV